MFSNPTINEDNQQYSNYGRQPKDSGMLGKHHPQSDIGDEFEDELEFNLHELGTGRNLKYKDSPKIQQRHKAQKPIPKERQAPDPVESFVQQYFHTQTKMKADEFLTVSLDYFMSGYCYTQSQFALVLAKTKKILTTSNPEYVSLNALLVLNKERPLKVLLMELLLDAKYKIKSRDLDAKHTHILQALTSLEKEIAVQKETLVKRNKQTKDKEIWVGSREKELLAKQRDLKSIVGKQYERLQAKLSKMYGQKAQDLDKKSANIERSLKYKIQILDKRLEELNNLKSVQKADMCKLKDKVTRLQKQNQVCKSRAKEAEGLYQSALAEQEQIVSKNKSMQDRLTKYEQKTVSLKEKLKSKEHQISSMQSTLVQLRQQAKAAATEAKEQPPIKKEQSQKSKQHGKKAKVSKTDQSTVSQLVLFISSFVETVKSTSLKLVNSYIQEADKQLSLPQLLFPKGHKLIDHFYRAYSALLVSYPDICLSPEAVVVVTHIVQLIFFCHMYTRLQHSQNILDKVFDKQKSKTSSRGQFYVVDDDLSSLIISQTKKLLKTLELEQTLIMAVFSFLSASSTLNKSSSLVIINEIITDSVQLKQVLIDLGFVSLFLEKLDHIVQEVEPFLDILLELVSEEQSRVRLFEDMYTSEAYKQLWIILPLMVDKVSIVLQRFYYQYKEARLQNSQKEMLRRLQKQLEKGSLACANLQSIQDNG